MQNKANFRKVKLNVSPVNTKDYDQMDTWSIRKTKPIQSQLKPIKANQSQFKANSKPIKANIMPKQTQFKPNLSRRSLWRRRNKPNFNRPTYTGNCFQHSLRTGKNNKAWIYLRVKSYENGFLKHLQEGKS